MKTITPQKLMKILSIVFIILSAYYLFTDFIVFLYIFSVRGIVRLINDGVFLVFGIYSIRNCDLPSKERKLIKMSAIAFVSSLVSTLVYYVPLLTRLGTETAQLIGISDILHIALAVLAAVYFFAARRNLASKDYH